MSQVWLSRALVVACVAIGCRAAPSAAPAVLQGDHDFIDPSAAQWTALAARAPSVEVHVLEGAGHHGWIDNPDAFHRALGHGLGRTRRAPAH